jgi:hypothetical protein
MSIPEEHIQKTMQILTNWNPLGDKANLIKDLDNYRTEAIDILFHIDSFFMSSDPSIVVRDILNQAFDLALSRDECS